MFFCSLLLKIMSCVGCAVKTLNAYLGFLGWMLVWAEYVNADQQITLREEEGNSIPCVPVVWFIAGLVFGIGLCVLPEYFFASAFGSDQDEDDKETDSASGLGQSRHLSLMYDSEMPQRRLLNVTWNGKYWMNFGFWDGTRCFPEAAEALAFKLGKEVGLGETDVCLDVGCGCGDQVFYFKDRFSVCEIVGIDIVPKQISIAQKRLRTRKAAVGDQKIAFFATDAVRMPISFEGKFSKVLCLDSAYHFSTREQFLYTANLCMTHNGKIGLIDICLLSEWSSYSLMERTSLYIVSSLFHIPIANMGTVKDYETCLRKSGFSVERFEDISESVVPGFVEFVKRHQIILGSIALVKPWIGLKIASWMLNSSYVRNVFGFFCIVAKKT